MIDKVIITLTDSGHFQINVGDVHFVNTPSVMEMMLVVKDATKKLAFFPKSLNSGIANPITFEEFQKQYAKSKPKGVK